MIKVDGSIGEGGGQMLRTALALSCVTKKPFTMHSIRKGREKPGLKAEHLCCVDLLKQICSAQVQGATLGSTELTFIPGTIRSGDYTANVGTAGSITLVLQSLLLPSLFAGKPTTLQITGGTDVKWAQPIDFFSHALLFYLHSFATFDYNLLQRGYFPKGQGVFTITITPHLEAAKAFNLLFIDEPYTISGITHASNELSDAKVSERLRDTAEKTLQQTLIRTLNQTPVSITAEYRTTASIGCGITLFASNNKSILAADCVGEKSITAEHIGKTAALQLLEEINARGAVDSHMADNLIPFLGIFGGTLQATKLTEHTLTNITLCEQFLPCQFIVNQKDSTVRSTGCFATLKHVVEDQIL